MAITINKDKLAIQSILAADDYLRDYLQFSADEIYRTKSSDKILNSSTRQIFIYNETPEPTLNPIVFGIVYEVDVSAPIGKSGTVDLAIEQIIALLHNTEISNTHRLELLDPPVVLASDAALYQVGVRFVTYVTIYNKKKTI